MSEQTPEPALLPVVPSAIRDAAQSELTRLNTYVQSLPLDRWNERSAVKEWSIGDVVVHLNLAFGLYTRLLAAASSGKGQGTFWKTLSSVGKTVAPVAAPAFNAVNSAIPRLIDRAMAPEAVKGQLAAGARRLGEQLDRIGPEDYTRPVNYVGGPYPLSFFLALVLNEMAIHGWDIESALTPNARLSHAARSVLPCLYFSATPLMFKPPKGTSGTVQVRLDDPTSEMWWKVGEGKPQQGTGTTATPDATIRGPSGTFILALAGRIPAESALGPASLQMEGNTQLAKAFLGAWKLI